MDDQNRTSEAARGRLSRALGTLAAFCLVLSLCFPYWQARVFAPQYREGLTARMYPYRVGGDAREIDGLNHYIGMSKLKDLARWERLVGIPSVLILAFLCWYLPRRPRSVWRWILALPVFIYPFAFVADMAYWMRYASSHLDPTAPLKIKPFTIPILGTGKIAQFQSTVGPHVGFYLVLLAIAALAAALSISAPRPKGSHA